MDNLGSFVIKKYKLQVVDGEPKIVISMIKALDKNGKYIKFVSMKEAEPLLSQVPVTFDAQ
jgi:hypothetical protein